MFGALAALVLSLAASASALAPHHSAQLRRHNARGTNVTFAPRSTSYKLVDEFSGQNFFDGWDFFTDADPTHGLVNFVDGDAAKKLAYVQSDNTIVLAVDDSDGVPVGGKRNSIRISSKKSWTRGLFVADIFAMPHGCGVWPAYWSLGNGADWPNAGEIDIIEGVNTNTKNQVTLHSGPGCTLDKAAHALADVLGTSCASSNGDNAGCAYQQTQNTSFGHGFNMQAGGVFAHTLEADGISVWFFDRDAIPADVASKQPDPASWGTPTAYFPNTQCDIMSHFLAQNLIFDITVCGDWAGSAYSQSGCPATCNDAVANSSNFNLAQWKISSVRVYQ
ncbi:glycoside hydrolase family 16 protein [Dichomitus squalens]|nr:glycoside hydrolase family 16 protein [Dichomitus squalens LYAD-421 SS1]EJF57193.1 glycoside hydrolase family 16 protein [Dichomitus squalens LYAD-421 SS1]TBU47571.1 glycoside hydrolase family 16 protein [Dichomitus squalens]TBU57770.1 glycoside hydrolase family 16 protein [Dichomitus squalens]